MSLPKKIGSKLDMFDWLGWQLHAFHIATSAKCKLKLSKQVLYGSLRPKPTQIIPNLLAKAW